MPSFIVRTVSSISLPRPDPNSPEELLLNLGVLLQQSANVIPIQDFDFKEAARSMCFVDFAELWLANESTLLRSLKSCIFL